jgi:GTPase involved in cell partitioning and DNA repair
MPKKPLFRLVADKVDQIASELSEKYSSDLESVDNTYKDKIENLEKQVSDLTSKSEFFQITQWQLILSKKKEEEIEKVREELNQKSQDFLK